MPIDDDNNKKRPIPERFRASMDAADKAGSDLLAKNDAQQKEWAKGIASPFARGDARSRLRAKALIEIEALWNAVSLTADQREMLAECYAAIGRYDFASNVSTANAEVYRKYWNAVFLPDEDWCEHAESQKYVKEIVFSVKEACEMPLLACNVCGMWNVRDMPQRLSEVNTAEARTQVAAQSAGGFASINDALRWHQANPVQK